MKSTSTSIKINRREYSIEVKEWDNGEVTVRVTYTKDGYTENSAVRKIFSGTSRQVTVSDNNLPKSTLAKLTAAIEEMVKPHLVA